MNQARVFRSVAAVAAAAWLAAALSCANSDERRAEEAMLTADSEEGGVQGLLSLNYEITSEVFRKWKRAQLSLDRVLGRTQSRSLKASIIGARPTREAIEASVRRIENNTRANRAIQEAGMSPRHYVVATVALFQATRGVDPITGEAFRGVPARNVEFAERNRAEIESTGHAGAFQQIADSIARVRAGAEGARLDPLEVIVDTVPRMSPPPPPPPPVPTHQPSPPPPSSPASQDQPPSP